MRIEELVAGKLYSPTSYPHWHFIFLSIHGNRQDAIFAVAFKYNVLHDTVHEITNTDFWKDAVEIPFSDVAEWMPKEYMPKIAENYQIY